MTTWHPYNASRRETESVEDLEAIASEAEARGDSKEDVAVARHYRRRADRARAEQQRREALNSLSPSEVVDRVERMGSL